MRRRNLSIGRAALLFAAIALLSACGGGGPTTPRPSLPTAAPPQSVGTPLTGNPTERLNQGQAALAAGNLAEAEQAYRAASGLDPRSAQAQFGLGNVYVRQGRLAEAEAAYRNALALDPNLGAARTNLGVVHYQQGNMSQAATEFEAALSLNPNDAQSLYLLGAVRIQNGQYADAEKLLNQAKAAQPDLAEVHYGLGALYKLQGRKAEAIAAFEKFLSLGTAQDPTAEEQARAELAELKQ